MKVKKILPKKILTFILAGSLSATSITIPTPKKMANVDAKQYTKYFQNIKPKYKNTNYFHKNISEFDFTDFPTGQNCTYNYDGDLNKLVNQIKKNTKKYLASDTSAAHVDGLDNFENPFYDGKGDEYQKLFIKSLFYALDNIIKKSTNDLNSDLCHINDLKIVFGTSPEGINASYVHGENLIVISKGFLNNYSEVPERLDELMKTVLIHELDHCRQDPCKHLASDIASQYDTFMDEEEIAEGLTEASAESAIYNFDYAKLSDNLYTYSYERKQESYLLLLGLLNDKTSLNDYYSGVFDNNLNKLKQFWNISSDEDAKEIDRIITSLVLNANFMDSDQAIEIKEELSTTYNIEIFKRVLTNMINYTCNHKEFTLEENLTIFNLVRLMSIKKIDIETFNEDSNNKKQIINLSNKYNEFLTKFYNKTTKQINKLYFEEENANNINIITEFLTVYPASSQLESSRWYYFHQAYPKVSKEGYEQLKNKTNYLLKKYPILKAVLFENSTCTYNCLNWQDYLKAKKSQDQEYYNLFENSDNKAKYLTNKLYNPDILTRKRSKKHHKISSKN